MRVLQVRRQVRKTVRLYHHHNWDLILVMLQRFHERVHVLQLVLLDALRAVPQGVVVASPVTVPAAADLTRRRFRTAVPVWEVVPNEDHQLSRGCCGSIPEDALNA
eukprot:CAMPEP_0179067592 /NCGR_PEP_ID=MMETSP0796-20121207/29566_1 /TAXON_ID=73915 /ORGANISM="Pyrodinium bahamense, Strain pbaha01" /LENGTH=105 /DNA_ID=CAMNT_0020764621 /DNA_START=126 /DNA_END=440 /DNA_ORIENTATION=-